MLTTGHVFDQAVEDHLIARSPMTKVKLARADEHAEQHFLTADQVNVLAAAVDDRYRVAVYLAAYGGLRAGELCGRCSSTA